MEEKDFFRFFFFFWDILCYISKIIKMEEKENFKRKKKFAHLFQHAYLLIRLGGEEAAVEGEQLQEMLHPHTHVVLEKLGQVLQYKGRD